MFATRSMTKRTETEMGNYFLLMVAIVVFWALLLAGLVCGDYAEAQRNGATL